MTAPFFLGLTVAEFAAVSGDTESRAFSWLTSNCYRMDSEGRIKPRTLPSETESVIAARIAAAPPSAPCFRCGCRHCACGDRIAA